MPNLLDASGLQFMTGEEWLTYWTEQYQSIYGADINLESNTPDGQMMRILIQNILDMQDLMMSVYNSFNPDAAIGVTLDQRCAINGVQRQAGTYSVTDITVVVSQSVNLYGVDQEAQEVYTVADNAGTRWVLETSQLGLAAGSHVLIFRAELPGEQLSLPNTITVPVTIVLGVVSINNPTPLTEIGINQETDAVLRVRRQRSVSLASQGYLAGLYAALRNINGVTSAFVYENTSDSVDVDGVPGHSIWVIVAGTGADADIAQAIYTKRNAGCGMKGDTTYTITQIDNTPFIIKWDEVANRTLFVAFTATSINGILAPNIDAIRAGLPSALDLEVFESVNINEIATAVQGIDPNTLVTGAGLTTGAIQIFTFAGTAASGVMRINYNGNESADINYGDTTDTIQTKVRAIPGLAGVTVTGTIPGGSLTINMSNLSDVVALLYVSYNTMQTAGLLPVTPTLKPGYTNTLTPPSKRNQLILSSANVIILAIQITPMAVTISTAAQYQFFAYGGYGALRFIIHADTTGGASVNISTGVLTAGPNPGTITLRAWDAFNNVSADATITVV